MKLKTIGRLIPKRLLAVAALSGVALAAATLVYGPTHGAWDLPNPGSNGFAYGVLEDSASPVPNTVFKLNATLVELPSPSISTRNGKIKGTLWDGGINPWPQYTMAGTWKGDTLTGNGTFKAEIFKQVSPYGAISLIGKMGGKYSDSGIWNPVGKFKGEWKANL